MPRFGPGDSPAISPYANPFRAVKNLSWGRVDQGVDVAGSGPIYALGPGVIEQTANGGWQPGGSFIAERLTSGPLRGQYVYVAEQVQPRVRVGQRVNSNTIIGYFAPDGGSVEAGFAAPPPQLGQALAYVKGQSSYTGDPGAHPTAEGRRYVALLGTLGGGPGNAGLVSGFGLGVGPPGSAGPGCIMQLPSLFGGGCAFRASQARAVVGGLIAIGGGLILLVGLVAVLARANVGPAIQMASEATPAGRTGTVLRNFAGVTR